MKRIVMWLGISIVMLGFGSGLLFAKGTSETTKPAGPVTLKFMNPEAKTTFVPVIQAFEAKYPNIKIQNEQVPFANLNDILETRLAAGSADPDVYTADQPRIPALVSRGFLVNVDQYKAEMQKKLFPSSIEASSWDGKVYAFPVDTSTQLLYYNKALLRKAGIPFPSVAVKDRMTWAQVVSMAKKAQAAGAKWGFVFDQVNRIYQIQPLPESLGGGSGLSGPHNLTPALLTKGWIDAMNFYASLFADGITPRGISPEQTPDLFGNGQTAFFWGGPWWLPKFTSTKGLEFGVAPTPYFAGGKAATPTDGWSWGLNPHSANQKAGLEYLHFATLTTEGANAVAKNFTIPPAYMDVLKSYYTQRFSNIQGLTTLISYEIANTSIHRPRSIGYIQYETIIGNALTDISNGANVRTTLQNAQQQLKSAFARLK